MKLSDMIQSYTQNMNLKAKLNKKIKLDNGVTLKKGTVSDFLIKRKDGSYHFESQNTACTVTVEEITFI